MKSRFRQNSTHLTMFLARTVDDNTAMCHQPLLLIGYGRHVCGPYLFPRWLCLYFRSAITARSLPLIGMKINSVSRKIGGAGAAQYCVATF